MFLFYFCINIDRCGLDDCGRHAYVKQWKYVPLTRKRPHPNLTWQEMHTKEVVVSLDRGRVFDVVSEGMWTLSLMVS